MDETDRRAMDRLGWKQKEQGDKLENFGRGLSDLVDRQQKDHERLDRFIAVSESAAKAAKDAADRSLSAKQLYISLGVFLLALAALIIGLH